MQPFEFGRASARSLALALASAAAKSSLSSSLYSFARADATCSGLTFDDRRKGEKGEVGESVALDNLRVRVLNLLPMLSRKLFLLDPSYPGLDTSLPSLLSPSRTAVALEKIPGRGILICKDGFLLFDSEPLNFKTGFAGIGSEFERTVVAGFGKLSSSLTVGQAFLSSSGGAAVESTGTSSILDFPGSAWVGDFEPIGNDAGFFVVMTSKGHSDRRIVFQSLRCSRQK